MRRFPFFAGLAITVLFLTAAACSSNGNGQQSSSAGSSAVAGGNSGGASGVGSGGAAGNSSAVVSSQTGGAAGTTASGGTTATGGSSSPGGSGGASNGGSAGTGSGGSQNGGGGTATGAATATGGNSGRGGSAGTTTSAVGSGGSGSGGSRTATGGATATGGNSGRGGSGGTATGGASLGGIGGSATGGGRSGGVSGSGGAGGSGGSTGAAGAGGAAGSPGDGGTSTTCGASTTPNPNPFGCTFGWGVNGSPASYLQFASDWAGYNITTSGVFGSNGFNSASFLKSFANSTAVPTYYAYIIGYYGHALGYPDGNLASPGQKNLTNAMGPVLLGVDNAACPSGTICDQNLMVKAYAWYAAQTYAVYKKPVIWLLEGDFVQYSVEGDASGLSYAQLGQLAAQITMAIKCNDPPAVVAIDYSGWISSSQLTSYFGGIAAAMTALGASYDMVWTTGPGSSASPGTSTYANLHTVTGKPLLVDESFGASAQSDTWANQTAATINARIAGGVVAANITTQPPSYLQTNLTTTLAPSALNSTCP
jgi:hypothetical protein